METGHMQSIRSHIRTSIVGYVALFFALTAGAYAAGLAPDSIRSKHIKDGQVKSADVADEGLSNLDLGPDSVTTSEIASNTVGADEIATGAAGSAEIANDSIVHGDVATDGVGKPELAANTVGSEEMLAINEVVNTQTLPGESALTVTATCPAGQQILTGGFSGVRFVQGGGHVSIEFSRRAPGAWEARFRSSFGAMYGGASVSTYAYCLSA